MSQAAPSIACPRSTASLARLALATLLLTFIIARVTVLLVMLRWVPDLFLHVRGTHIHHLNYGIVLLAAVGAVLLFANPSGPSLSAVACLYGVGLALTFDEFGMWMHLGGPYWQRASFDAVVVIAALLALIAFAPAVRRWGPRHWTSAALLAIATGLLAILLVRSLKFANQRISPILQQIEAHGPD